MRGAARKHTPMFTVDKSHAAMSHAFANELFRALAEHALGNVANTLSLHGGQIFLEVALRARGYSAASPSGPPTRTASDLRDNASASSGSDDDSDGAADGVVVAGPPVDVGTIGPGDAVRFNSRRGGMKANGGVVVKNMARPIRVKFCSCGGSETYDVNPERILTVAP